MHKDAHKIPPSKQLLEVSKYFQEHENDNDPYFEAVEKIKKRKNQR